MSKKTFTETVLEWILGLVLTVFVASALLITFLPELLSLTNKILGG